LETARASDSIRDGTAVRSWDIQTHSSTPSGQPGGRGNRTHVRTDARRSGTRSGFSRKREGSGQEHRATNGPARTDRSFVCRVAGTPAPDEANHSAGTREARGTRPLHDFPNPRRQPCAELEHRSADRTCCRLSALERHAGPAGRCSSYAPSIQTATQRLKNAVSRHPQL
jgi:hypothetical protein